MPFRSAFFIMMTAFTLLAMVGGSEVFPQDLYVSPTGTGLECSLDAPCDLQVALNQCASNREDDIVHLLGGTYHATHGPFTYEDQTGLENSAISLVAAQGLSPGQVVLDGANSSQVLAIEDLWNGNTNVNVTIKGITIRDANNPSGHGGGLYIGVSGSVTILHTSFQHNVAPFGGGLYVATTNSTITIEDCNFTGNNATYGEGGGLLASAIGQRGVLILNDSRFSGNWALSNGGGASVSAQGKMIVARNWFNENISATQSGGAIIASPQTSCRTFIFTRNTILQNSAHNYGGGAYIMENGLEDCTVAVTDNLFAQNGPVDGAYLGGGGLFYTATQSASSFIANNTFAENHGTWGPQAYLIVMDETSSIVLINNIFWRTGEFYNIWIWTPVNDHGDSGAIYGFNNDYAHVVRQTTGDHYKIDDMAWDDSQGNVHEDPNFLNPAEFDYRVAQHSSACIDSGTTDPQLVPHEILPPWDLNGGPRIDGCHIDIGALEGEPEGLHACIGDMDQDGDVDGEDLYALASSIYALALTMGELAEFGRSNCLHCN